MDFGMVVRRFREAMGWSVKELASRMGYSPEFVKRLENHQAPFPQVEKDVERVAGMSLAQLNSLYGYVTKQRRRRPKVSLKKFLDSKHATHEQREQFAVLVAKVASEGKRGADTLHELELKQLWSVLHDTPASIDRQTQVNTPIAWMYCRKCHVPNALVARRCIVCGSSL